LTGKDIADVLNGGVITVNDVEFIYDGLGMIDIQKAIKALEQRTDGGERKIEARRPYRPLPEGPKAKLVAG